MTYVVTDRCIGETHQDCVAVCPVEAFVAVPPDNGSGPLLRQMVIDPDACTACGACAQVCPVAAIYDEDSLPPEHAAALEKNARLAVRHALL